MTLTAFRSAAVAGIAFAAGFAVSHVQQPARAAGAPLQPAVIDLAATQPSDLPTPTPASPNLRSKILAAADGATVQLQIGTVAKHYHAEANEIQIVLAGSGTEWLGDKQVALRPGLMLVIPAGTPHAGTVDPNLRIVSIKTPPQAATDVHPVP
jgi:mannose-6-phosphate isomerase-like protein (cupin superfamily)